MKKSRRRIFIKDELYRNLTPEQKKRVDSYRGVLGALVKKEKEITRHQDKIGILKEEIDELGEKLSDKNIDIDNLRNDFEFSVSIVRTNPKGFEYYNVVISRRTKTPKNIYLGSDKKIKKHLLEYYKKDETRLKKINKDWLAVLGHDLKVGIKYDFIYDLMFKLDYNFETTTINLDTLYPLHNDNVIK